MGDFQFINHEQRETLGKAIILISSVYKDINPDYEEYPSLSTSIYQLQRAIKMHLENNDFV